MKEKTLDSKGTVIKNTFDKWFVDENLSHLKVGDVSYITKKRKGKKVRLYGIISEIKNLGDSVEFTIIKS